MIKRKESVKKEMENIYDKKNLHLWLSAGKSLKQRFTKTLESNKILSILLKLSIFTATGVYLLVVLFSTYWYLYPVR